MRLVGITITCAVLAGAVWAQTMVEDADGDGVYSMEEMRAAYPDVSDDVLVQIDVNEDGAIDEDELAAAIAVGVLES
ncbi:MAG: hypothetical protein KJO30_01465 [Boseongicola sp.]|nr:hypothetical protein [Boseongicola sp.]NNJ66431.1 hypothetical protein [Boseongicola sp.]